MKRVRENKPLIQSYLFTEKFGNFFVSTAYRKSSMTDYEVWYFETFAWKLDKDKHRTDWVVEYAGFDDEGYALKDHMEVIKQLNLTGKFNEEDCYVN